jgi:hypothetical protein
VQFNTGTDFFVEQLIDLSINADNSTSSGSGFIIQKRGRNAYMLIFNKNGIFCILFVCSEPGTDLFSPPYIWLTQQIVTIKKSA